MKYIITLALIFICLTLKAQKKIGANGDYNAGIHVGEMVPDFPLGIVSNNKSGKTRMSDYKGKLVIFDFWATTCGSCIANWPKLESLQKQFGDKIQIILVNWAETQGRIDTAFSQPYLRSKKIPDFPSIVMAKNSIGKYFPMFAPGDHVWIDPNGKVVVRGDHYNTNAENIEAVLNGKEIKFMMKGQNNSRPVDPNEPYHKILNEKGAPGLAIGSFITKFNNEYYTFPGTRIENKIDSSSLSIRSSYINLDVLELYYSVFRDEFVRQNNGSILFGKYSLKGSLYWYNFLDLKVKDTTNYTSSLIKQHDIDARTYTKSRFCYEQVLPISVSSSYQKQRMLDDLNIYFSNIYGLKAYLTTRDVPCYLLIKAGGATKTMVDKSGNSGSLSQVLSAMLSVDFKDLDRPIVNGTDILKGVKFDVPDRSIKNIEQLNTAIAAYGLQVVKSIKRLPRLILEEEQINRSR